MCRASTGQTGRILHVRSVLDRLDLAETGITNAGLRHLTGLTSLKHLNLTDTNVTAEGVEILKKALPSVEIEWKAK